MQTIWKYPLETTDVQTVMMPKGAKPLTVAVQGSQVCLWALVDSEADPEARDFVIYGTGHPVRDVVKRDVGEVQTYVGTYQLDNGSLVFHVFEIATTIKWSDLKARANFQGEA